MAFKRFQTPCPIYKIFPLCLLHSYCVIITNNQQIIRYLNNNDFGGEIPAALENLSKLNNLFVLLLSLTCRRLMFVARLEKTFSQVLGLQNYKNLQNSTKDRKLLALCLSFAFFPFISAQL